MNVETPVRVCRRPRIPLPPGTVFVGKGSRWQNPYDYTEVGLTPKQKLALYKELISGCWSPSIVDNLSDEDYAKVYDIATAWRKRIGGHPAEVSRIELRGKNLACWCSETSPSCHADILLQYTNR